MRTLHLIPLLISASLLPPAAARVALAAPRVTAVASSALPCRIGMRCKPVHRQICGMRGMKRPIVRRRDVAGCSAYTIDLDFRLAYAKNRAEDASLVHRGAGPAIVALLRDAAVNLLRASGYATIASQLRRHAQFPHEAVALITFPLSTHAEALGETYDPCRDGLP
jgi:hypothetical protein